MGTRLCSSVSPTSAPPTERHKTRSLRPAQGELQHPNWSSKGITHLQHMYKNNNIIPFSHFRQKHGIGSDQFLQYLQIKAAIKNAYNTTTLDLELPPHISEFISITRKKQLSKIYKIISKTDGSLHIPTNKWEADLVVTPDANFWLQIIQNIYTMTTDPNLQLIQFKVLHRTHYTNHKLSKMGFTSSFCNNCLQNTTDTYIHAFWHCTPIQEFWKNVTLFLSTFFDCHIPLCPSLCVLGDTSALNFNNNDTKILLVALTVARKTILMNWKTRHKTNINHWKNLLLDFINLDSSNEHNTESTSIWSPLLAFLT